MGNIKIVKEIGEFQTYDLEVNHPDHQFYLSNGMLTSNSHATFYSMIAFGEAYLKAHYPIEFLLAKLMDEVKSNAPTAAGNIKKIKTEIKDLKVKIIPPDINNSELRYVLKDNKLITGLDAIKFVSDDAIKDIVDKRPFASFQDFMSRIESKKVRANTIQALAACGALESFGIARHLIYLYCSDYRKKLQVWSKKHDPSKEEFFYPWPDEPAWTKSQVYALEQFYLGEAFVCGIRDAYGDFFKDREYTALEKIKKMNDKTSIKSVKAIVRDLFEFKVKKEGKYQGQSMVKATVEDVNGEQCGLTIFPDRWALLQERIKEQHKEKVKFDVGVALHFSGSANLYEDDMGIIMDKIYDVRPIPQKPVELKAKKVNLKVSKKDRDKGKEETGEDAWFTEVEDELYEEGLIDLDNEDD